MWIEIDDCFRNSFSLLVTPLAGVWIEISVTATIAGNAEVTPLAGVWIEILLQNMFSRLLPSSLPLRECGLKFIR